MENQQSQLPQALVNTSSRIETTDTGVKENTATSLCAGLRVYNLLGETATCKKTFHFGTSASLSVLFIRLAMVLMVLSNRMVIVAF